MAVVLTGRGAAGQSVSIGSPARAADRPRIVAIAQAEVGASEANGGCDKYGSPPYNCHNTEWCAMFIIWVWQQAGVSPVFTTYTARAVGLWGQQQGLFKRRPAGGIGNPVLGDIAVFGEPGTTPGGHVGIVAAVNGDGTIDTINGNFSEAVRRTNHIAPRTVTAGADGVPISGYVSPPNIGAP